MRLYAFLPLALFALAARAATIPETVASQAEKKIDVIPNDTSKTPDNASSEQELVEQSNTINDVDNKLRAKPEDIPVEVIVENAESALKTSDESEEIIRPPVDLRNPGPPQRQEHETQNPEFYAAEQEIVQIYKKNINDAQMFLKQGFQSVSEGIQNLVDNNEPIKSIQQNIQSFREGFIAQISNMNATIQNYLNADNINAVSPTKQQTKANFLEVESSLNALKSDFTRGVKTLTDGVQVFSSLKAENQKPEEDKPSAGVAPAPASSTPAPASPAPMRPMEYLTDLVNRFQSTLQSNFNNYMSQAQAQLQGLQPSTAASAAAPPAVAQSDTQAPAASPAPTNWLGFPNLNLPNLFNPSQGQNVQQEATQQPAGPPPGQGPFAQILNNFSTQIGNIFSPNRPPTQTSQVAPSAQPAPSPQPTITSAPTINAEKPSEQAQPEKNPETKPEEGVKPQESVAATNQVEATTTLGPIRQILQNNPISQGIASAVQRLQNINNPEKPREPEKEKAVEEPAQVNNELKGHPPAVGDNNISSGGVEESEPVKEVQNETLPEAQENKKESAVTEQKTEEVVDKTE